MVQDSPLTNLLDKRFGSIPVIIAFVLITAIVGVTVGITLDTSLAPTFQDSPVGQERPNAFKVESGYGNVSENKGVNNIRLIVAKGDERIDVSKLTIMWIGPKKTEALVNGTQSQMQATHQNVTVGNSLYFSIQAISDQDNSVPVLNDKQDRFRITMNATAIRGTPLKPGQEVNLKLRAIDGSLELYTIKVPNTLSNKSEIEI